MPPARERGDVAGQGAGRAERGGERSEGQDRAAVARVDRGGRRRPDTSRSARAAAAAAPRAGTRGRPRPDGRTRGAAARPRAAHARRARGCGPRSDSRRWSTRRRRSAAPASEPRRGRVFCDSGWLGSNSPCGSRAPEVWPSRSRTVARASPRQRGVPAHDRVVEAQLALLDQPHRERRRRELRDAVERERGVRRHRPPRLHHRIAGRAAPHAPSGNTIAAEAPGMPASATRSRSRWSSSRSTLAVSRGPGGAGRGSGAVAAARRPAQEGEEAGQRGQAQGHAPTLRRGVVRPLRQDCRTAGRGRGGARCWPPRRGWRRRAWGGCCARACRPCGCSGRARRRSAGWSCPAARRSSTVSSRSVRSNGRSAGSRRSLSTIRARRASVSAALAQRRRAEAVERRVRAAERGRRGRALAPGREPRLRLAQPRVRRPGRGSRAAPTARRRAPTARPAARRRDARARPRPGRGRARVSGGAGSPTGDSNP